MVDKESLADRLKHFSDYIKILKELKKVNKNSFIQDYHYHGLAERYLQLSIECLLDIGSMLILSLDLRKPSHKQEVVDILEEEKEIKVCAKCGEPANQKICNACQILEVLKC